MAHVKIYKTANCSFCRNAIKLLSNKGVEIEEIDIEQFPEKRQEMIDLAGGDSVPQIFVNDNHIGGFDDLSELDMDDELDPLLQ
ncbi:MAG: glutaredoxin 3 [Pseudomonadota bacterium]